MATESKAKEAKVAKEHPELTALRQQEAKLKNKIGERIPKLPEDRQQEALDRAQQHLDGVQAKIKALSKAS